MNRSWLRFGMPGTGKRLTIPDLQAKEGLEPAM